MPETDESSMIPPEEAALHEAAAWLLAGYGGRLAAIELVLEAYEGYQGSNPSYYGICPIPTRGIAADGNPETRDTLPSLELRTLAEAIVQRILPRISFSRENRDVRPAGYTRVRAVDLSAHERLGLLARHGTRDDVWHAARTIEG